MPSVKSAVKKTTSYIKENSTIILTGAFLGILAGAYVAAEMSYKQGYFDASDQMLKSLIKHS